jgi:hypothetical protein
LLREQHYLLAEPAGLLYPDDKQQPSLFASQQGPRLTAAARKSNAVNPDCTRLFFAFSALHGRLSV